MRYVLWLLLFSLACREQNDCVRYNIEVDTEYTAGHDGTVWASSNAAICTISVNRQERISGKGVSYPVKKDDLFKVTKSKVNFAHSFESWFDCAEE